jgi:hypothetical protein
MPQLVKYFILSYCADIGTCSPTVHKTLKQKESIRKKQLSSLIVALSSPGCPNTVCVYNTTEEEGVSYQLVGLLLLISQESHFPYCLLDSLIYVDP